MADLALSPGLFQSQQNQFPIKMTRSWEDMFTFQTYKFHLFSLSHDNSSAGNAESSAVFSLALCTELLPTVGRRAVSQTYRCN